MRLHHKEFLYYIDESGSRDPDRKPSPNHLNEPNWFGIGGVIIDANDKSRIEDEVDRFKSTWNIPQADYLRSYDIRNKSAGFRWLNDLDPSALAHFYQNLSDLILNAPIVVAGCVVHRPGYNQRYVSAYGERRWKLCKTAFNIAIERSVKYALMHNAKLRVFVERSDKKTERQLKEYYESLRLNGLPFNKDTSTKYNPLSASELKTTLFEFSVKTKNSHIMQLADVTLWPICRGGYHPNDRNFLQLQQNKKLLDSQSINGHQLLGIKYSCFDAT